MKIYIRLKKVEEDELVTKEMQRAKILTLMQSNTGYAKTNYAAQEENGNLLFCKSLIVTKGKI